MVLHSYAANRPVRVAVVLAVVLVTLLGVAHRPPTAQAFSANYCGYTLYVGGSPSACGQGAYHSITYNAAHSRSLGGVCSQMVTAAGNRRGQSLANNGIFCNVSTDVYECFSADTPMSEGQIYPIYSTKVMDGTEDNSPNHTGCN